MLTQDCKDGLTLADYGLDAPFLRQVCGFVLRPRDWQQQGGGGGGAGSGATA